MHATGITKRARRAGRPQVPDGRVLSFGFRVVSFRVQGVGQRVLNLAFSVLSLGFRVLSSGFRVWGLGSWNPGKSQVARLQAGPEGLAARVRDLGMYPAGSKLD